MEHLSISRIEKVVGLPVDQWPGNCYSLAYTIVKESLFPGAVVRYGHYYGPVVKSEKFDPRKPVQRHGWCELNGQVLDPTRWVFEGVAPYVYHADYSTDYDAGSLSLWWATHAGFPEPEFRRLSKSQKIEHLDINLSDKLFENIRRVIWAMGAIVAAGNPVRFNIQQVHWLATMPPQWLGLEGATELYTTLAAMGQLMIIPQDHRRDVLVSKSLAPLHPGVPRYGVLDPRKKVPNPLG